MNSSERSNSSQRNSMTNLKGMGMGRNDLL
jgi:hypothetical protein